MYFAERWFVPFEDVKYEAYHFKNGEMSNENTFKSKADYAAYKEAVEEPLAKFKFNTAMIADFKENLMPEISSLIG